MAEPQNATPESILLNNEATKYKVEPEIESQVAPVDETVVIKEPEVTEPAPEQEAEIVDEVVEEVVDEIESQEDPEGEDEEYTQAEWDALPEEEREKIDAEWKASQEATEQAEADRQAQQTETAEKFKREKLDFEKKKLDWEAQKAESKKEADKLVQQRMEEFSEATKELEVSEKWKHLKAKGREKAKEDAPESRFGKFTPKPMLTQEDARNYKLSPQRLEQENRSRAAANATGQSAHDKMVGIFGPVVDYVQKALAREAQQEMTKTLEGKWSETMEQVAKEAGFELRDGNTATPEAIAIYHGIRNNGFFEHGMDMSDEQRANNVKLILGSTNGSAASPKADGQLTVTKLTKAPPGQTLQASSKTMPRKKRPPKTLGGSGTGSRSVQRKREDNKDILAGNR